MIYDVTIAVEKELSHWESHASTRKQLHDLGVTKLKWITARNSPEGHSQTWRVFTADDSLGTLFALKFESVSTQHYDIITDNLQKVEAEYAERKAHLLAKINGDDL